MTVFDLIARLQEAQLHFTLTTVRDDAIMLNVAVPGERWEVEVFADGQIEFERFRSAGDVVAIDAAALVQLVSHWSEQNDSE